MPSVFENLSEHFYTAFLEADPESRKAALEGWVRDAAPIVQSAVEGELRALVELILNNGKEPKNWRHMAEKFSHYADRGKGLTLEFTIRSRKEPCIVAETLSPAVRARTIELARTLFPEGFPTFVVHKQPAIDSGQGDDDSYDGGHDHGHSPNDDRSDSMNPNNDAYQSSMDNRSDQMNPNNDSYWSSRGH
jgi:hypothetical protein